MDDAAALALLDEFLGLLNESKTIYDENHQTYFEHPRWGTLQEQINNSLPGVRRIAEAVERPLLNKLASEPEMYTWEWKHGRDATHQLRGAIAQRERVDSILEPAGPKLAAAGLHPWVWQPAAKLWDDGHYRSALQLAATSVSSQLQEKLERHDLTDSDLVTRAFTDAEPEPGDARLRFTKYRAGSRAYKSAQQGAMSFGRGCMMAIRNLAVHETEELDEQLALEQLAALSVLARWIDEASVVTV